jgi:hypothetical protein
MSRPQIKLRLNLPRTARFQILSPSQPADVHSIRFCLVEHTTGVSPAGQNLTPIGPVFSYELTPTSNLELNFGHVRANAPDKSYSLAVAALNDQDQNITNQTGENAAKQRVTISGQSGNFYLSSSGGNPAYPGSVRVMPKTYALSGTDALGVQLKLADG